MDETTLALHSSTEVRMGDHCAICGQRTPCVWGDDDDGWECSLCASNWGADTGFDSEWHRDWCLHSIDWVTAQHDGATDG